MGDFKYDTLPGATDPAYLAQSDEVVLSDDINAKAAELNYDPVAIYHWVRNNVEWIPAWGSAQNAQLTLETLRGNAADIASLTIALLRASQIPARYVHGTIDVPNEAFMNWAGGFSDVTAAAQYAAAGGIPLGTLNSGGGVTHIRMEHVWVEAAIDFYPSRGAKNRVADRWSQFDPSFKQYTYHQGLDTVAISEVNTTNLAESFLASGTLNEAEGWVSDFNTSVIENALADAQAKLQTHVTGMTNPTVLDIIGGRKAIVQAFPTLPSSLPNAIVVEGARYGKLPTSLQQRVTIALNDPLYGWLNGSPSITYPYARVNNEKITLSFRPATTADEQALLAFLPDGNITDISQLPGSLPANLIEVIPELKLNGAVVASYAPMTLGSEFEVSQTVMLPGLGTQPKTTHKTVAGAFLSINTIAQSVSPKKLETLQNRLLATQTALQSGDAFQLSLLTREEILGDMMYAGTLGYFAQLQGFSEIAGLQAGAVSMLRAAEGVFGYAPQVNYLFGMPNTLSAGGIQLDIPMLANIHSLDNDNEKSKQFTIQYGMLGSSLEHSTPEMMFNTDPNNYVEAVSAVKALQKASAQGQKIYQITQANMDTALPNLNLGADAMSDIGAALSQGKEVIAHTDNISVPGWSGAGYIIIDPVTGDGAYMISGGMNGADFSAFADKLQGFLLLISSTFTIAQLIAKVKHFVLSAFQFALKTIFATLELGKRLIDITKNYETCKYYLHLMTLAMYGFFLSVLIATMVGFFFPGGVVAAGYTYIILSNILDTVIATEIEKRQEQCVA